MHCDCFENSDQCSTSEFNKESIFLFGEGGVKYFYRDCRLSREAKSASRCYVTIRSSNSIVGYAVVYILRLIGHTHDRESPIQNFSTAPKKLGAHISSPVWPPKPTEFVPYLVNLRCDAFTALKSVQSARNESFLAGSDNFHCVRSAI